MKLDIKTIKNIFFGFLALLFIQSCSFNEFENSNRIVDISNEIELILLPDLTEESNLKWYIGTKETRYCNEAFIETELIESTGAQELLLKGIISPSNCVILDERLISVESFDIQNEIQVNIEFTDELQSLIYLEKLGNNIRITHSEEDYFSFEQKQLKLFNKLTIWTGFEESSNFDLPDLTKYFDNFMQNVTTSSMSDGNYGFININEKNQEVLNPKTFEKYNNSLVFQIADEMDYDQLILQLLQISTNVTNDYPDLNFFIATSKGDVF